MEEEYKDAVAVKMGRFQDASFGKSVDIDGNLIVVGAPQENENQRSTTVFQKAGLFYCDRSLNSSL